MLRRRQGLVNGVTPFADRDTVAWLPLVVWPLGVAFGLLAERARFDWEDELRWMPDLAVGLVLVGAGAHALTYRRPPVAALLLAAGFGWFAANLWVDTVLVHRAILIHLVVAYPSGRPRTALGGGIVACGYALALLPALWADDRIAVATALALVPCAAASHRAGSIGRRARDPALAAAATLSIGIVGAVAVRAFGPGVAHGQLASLWYAAAIAATGLLAVAGLPRRVVVADRVVELAETTSGTLTQALADVLGDPSLEVGYWDGLRYVDADGCELGAGGPGRRVTTTIERDGEPFALVVHDASVLDDPALIEAIAGATRLTADHARLRATVRQQVDDLQRSRSRLILADDRERRQLAARLEAGAGRHLAAVARALELASQARGGEPSPPVVRALEVLADTQRDLDRLAEGLYPPELSEGLVAALRSLGDSMPIDVDLVVEGPGGEPAPDIGATVYFVCAEALANVVKHARVGRAQVHLAMSSDGVTVDVVDAGSGGAVPANGSGLTGLADRLEAVGGTLHVDSSPGRGTRIGSFVPTSSESSSSIGRSPIEHRGPPEPAPAADRTLGHAGESGGPRCASAKIGSPSISSNPPTTEERR